MSRCRIRLPALALCALAAATAGAQQLQLVKDINTTPGIWYRSELLFATLNGWTCFVRNDPATGPELHRVQPGTPPVLVADIAPGPAGSAPDFLTVTGNLLYFLADDGIHGRELWRSDGTAAGTHLVLDIRPGNAGAIIVNHYFRQPLPVMNGQVWFAADDGVHGAELWASDGTAAGTRLVKDFVPGPAGIHPRELAVSGNLLYFAGSPGPGPNGSLMVSDGTVAGTVAVAALYAPPYGFTELNGLTYFIGGTGPTNYELWRTDGTPAGTALFADIHPGGSSNPGNLTVLGGLLLFTADDGLSGRELWRTDGTAAGTQRVADINPGAGNANYLNFRIRFPIVQGRAVFGADDGAGRRVWVSDGTAAGTAPVTAGPADPVINPDRIDARAAAGGRCWFEGTTAGAGSELWTTDGTTAGTMRVTDLVPGAGGANPRGITGGAGGEATILADTGPGPELWRAVAGGATLLSDRAASALPATADAQPRDPVELDGRLLFAADDGVHGNELWVSDGTEAGTALVKDLWPGPFSGIWGGDPVAYSTSRFPSIRAGPRVFFMADDQGDWSLWASDGTTAGTTKVRSFDRVYDAGALVGWHLNGAELRDVAYFAGYTNAGGWAIWRSDGTPAGTYAISAYTYAPGSGFRMVRAGGRLFALAPTGLTVNLRVTDGTAAGTAWIGNLAGASLSSPELVASGDRVFFTMSFGPVGNELWTSDGTVAGTNIVRDLNPGSGSASPRSLTPWPGTGLVVFSATDGTSGREPYVTDGTAAGTARVADLVAGPGGSNPANFTVSGSRVFFSSQDAAGSVLLQVWDGAGIVPLLTLPVPGPYNVPGIAPLRAVGSRRVCFAATDASALGAELWVSDGTVAGTDVVCDLNTGSGYASPRDLRMLRGRVIVTAMEEQHGFELFTWFPGATAAPVGYGCASAGTAPLLLTEDPVLGGVSRVTVVSAPPLSPGVIAFGAPAVPPQGSGGCAVHLDLATALVLPFLTGAAGGYDLPPIAVPAVPGLAGMSFALQAAVLGPAATALTNGVLATFGN